MYGEGKDTYASWLMVYSNLHRNMEYSQGPNFNTMSQVLLNFNWGYSSDIMLGMD